MIVQNRHTALVSAFLVLLLSVMTVSLTSCKKDSWLDWKAQNAAFLVRNMQKDSIVTTPSGLQYKVIRQGIQGTKPDELKHVRIRYKGSLITGNVFDQSDDASLVSSGRAQRRTQKNEQVGTLHFLYPSRTRIRQRRTRYKRSQKLHPALFNTHL